MEDALFDAVCCEVFDKALFTFGWHVAHFRQNVVYFGKRCFFQYVVHHKRLNNLKNLY